MNKNKSRLVYHGDQWVHALGTGWSRGQAVSLDALYNKYTDRCPVSRTKDLAFVEWLFTNYIDKLGNNFQFIVSEDELVREDTLVADEDLPKEETQLPTGDYKLMVESSNLKVEDSLSKAKDNLVSTKRNSNIEQTESRPYRRNKGKEKEGMVPMEDLVIRGEDLDDQKLVSDDSGYEDTRVFHPESDGTMAVEEHTEVRRPRETMPKMEELVITGDQLAELQERTENQTAQTPPRFVLHDGKEIITSATDKEQREAERNRNLANLNTGVKVLDPAELMHDQVVRGENFESNVDREYQRVNSRTKFQSNFPERQEVTPEDIYSCGSDGTALERIKSCKDPLVLKVARIYCDNVGNQRLIDAIDLKLRTLHK